MWSQGKLRDEKVECPSLMRWWNGMVIIPGARGHQQRTVRRSLTRGTPQGGILSPPVWHIAFGDLLEGLRSFSRLKLVIYTFDRMFPIPRLCPDTLIGLVSQSSKALWSGDRKAGWSFPKRRQLQFLFSKNRKVVVKKALYMDGVELKLQGAIK